MSRPVLITGCSSGIGLATARLLAERGVPVVATVRNEADAERLAELPGVEPRICDVTDRAQVARLREAIDARGEGLAGLVNNAGIAQIGHLTRTPLHEMRRVFEVNVFGVHRVTNAVVDLIRTGRGRIVNVSSISGILSGEWMGVYSMTKHALEAYTDALAAELEHDGVHVAAIEPGNFASAILSNMVARFPLHDDASDRMRELYAPEADTSRSEHPSPDAVAEAIHAALYDPVPLRRYLVVPDEDEARVTLAKAAQELVQLNRYPPHRRTLDALRALIEEADAAEAAREDGADPTG